ncbi:MAG TPA: hypothetical protein VKZ53_11640 [Candidatus Angelobacter sp.]|nr:hypothetical protein [Candidatus Angelobacter sp.]
MKTLRTLLFFLAAWALCGCSDQSRQSEAKPAESQPEPDQFETGRFALQKMLVPAHLWSADAQPIQLQSQTMKGSNGHDGKAGFWRCTFASVSRQKAESFSWSGVASADMRRGVDHGTEDTFNPANRSTHPFDMAYLKIDSEEAFRVAQQHGGKEILAKKPDQEVIYLADWDPRINQLRWHVIYGASPSNAVLTVIVNASSGQFIHKE